MPRMITTTCECCELKYQRADRSNMYNVTGDYSLPRRNHCPECRYHQGGSVEQILKRLASHEGMLRKRLAAADRYARKAEAEVKESRTRVASALSSRDRTIKMLQRVNDLHTMRPNGTCSCGRRGNCPTAQVLYGDRWLQSMIGRQDRRDASDDEWGEFFSPGPRRAPGRKDTA